MSQVAYSSLKAAWYLDKIKALREGKQIVPTQVRLVISDLCNHDCHFCAYRMSNGLTTEQFADGNTKNPVRCIATDKCKEILDDCAALGVQAIQFTGGGEPCAQKDHLEIFEYALSLGMKCGLITNGSIFRNGWKKILPRFSWIRVSIDAGTAKTYASIRKVKAPQFAKTLNNVNSLAQEINLQQTKCLLGAGFVITGENYLEIVEGCKLFKKHNIPYVRLSAMFSTEGSAYYTDIFDLIKTEIKIAKELEDDCFKIVDLFGDRINDLDEGAPDYEFCAHQQFDCYIGGNLKIYRCCITAYTQQGEIGDITNQRFIDWFRSSSKQAAYGCFDARSCNNCMFNAKNRTVNYLIDPAPLHVEFV